MRPRGAVACGHPATAAAAATVLEEGGNAVDAALAAMCAACVAEPVLASAGGGGFLLARPNVGRSEGQAIVYDFFPQTPMHRRPAGEIDFYPVLADFGEAQQEFHIGMGAIATPGVVKGLFEAHHDLGRMPLRRLIEPAANLAREGVRLDAMQAYLFRVVGAILGATEASRALFASHAHPGELLFEGEVMRMPDFADALEVLAIEGADLFYRGEIAQRIVHDCQTYGGYLTAADLAGYRVERRRPLVIEAFDAHLYLNPPPSTGGILIAFALQLLRDAHFDAPEFGTAAYVERLARVMEMTNRARIESRLHELSPEDALRTLLHPEFINTYASGVLGRPFTARGTTHISVIDSDGSATSLSISNGEGAGYVVPNTAIMLNNMLGEEDINPHGFHRWPPDTRISSMMAPTIAVGCDGALTALGSGGSNRIRTAILQVLIHLLLFACPLADAVSRPRIHLENGRLSIEPGFPEPVVEALARRFPEIDRWQKKNLFFGGVHTVRMEPDGTLNGAGDPRRRGAALIV